MKCPNCGSKMTGMMHILDMLKVVCPSCQYILTIDTRDKQLVTSATDPIRDSIRSNLNRIGFTEWTVLAIYLVVGLMGTIAAIGTFDLAEEQWSGGSLPSILIFLLGWLVGGAYLMKRLDKARTSVENQMAELTSFLAKMS